MGDTKRFSLPELVQTPLDNNNIPINPNKRFSLPDLTPQKLPPSIIGENYAQSQYDVDTPLGADLNEFRAQRQTGADKWANGAVKFLGTIGTTLDATLSDIFYGLPKSVLERDATQLYDSPFNQKLNDFSNKLQQSFPTYYSNAEQNKSLGAEMFTNNFWSDKVLNGLGFTIGAIAGGLVTGGIGDWAMGLSRSSKVVQALAKLPEAERATMLAENGFKTVDDLIKYSKSIKFKQGLNAGLSNMAATIGEAGIEAQQGKNDFKNKRIEAILAEGRQPTGQELQDIEDYADAVGNLRFVLNLPIIGISNFVQFGKLFSKGYNTERKVLGQIEKTAGGFKAVPLTGLQKAYNVVKNPLTEALQETNQYTIEIGVDNYFTKKYNHQGQETTNDLIMSMMEGMSQAYGTKQGLEQGLIGLLIGGIGAPLPGHIGGGIREGIKENQEINKNTQLAAQALNDYKLSKVFKPLYDAATAHFTHQQNQDNALKSGDIFAYQSAKADDFFNLVNSRIETGQFEKFIDGLEDFSSMSDDELKKTFGFPEDQVLPKNAREFVNTIKKKAKEVYDINQSTEANFPHLSDKSKEYLNYLAYKMSDADRREQDMSLKLFELSGIDYKTLRRLEPKDYKKIFKEQFDQIKPDINPAKLPEVQSYFDDLQKLTIQREKLIKGYHQAASLESNIEEIAKKVEEKETKKKEEKQKKAAEESKPKSTEKKPVETPKPKDTDVDFYHPENPDVKFKGRLYTSDGKEFVEFKRDNKTKEHHQVVKDENGVYKVVPPTKGEKIPTPPKDITEETHPVVSNNVFSTLWRHMFGVKDDENAGISQQRDMMTLDELSDILSSTPIKDLNITYEVRINPYKKTVSPPQYIKKENGVQTLHVIDSNIQVESPNLDFVMKIGDKIVGFMPYSSKYISDSIKDFNIDTLTEEQFRNEFNAPDYLTLEQFKAEHRVLKEFEQALTTWLGKQDQDTPLQVPQGAISAIVTSQLDLIPMLGQRPTLDKVEAMQNNGRGYFIHDTRTRKLIAGKEEDLTQNEKDLLEELINKFDKTFKGKFALTTTPNGEQRWIRITPAKLSEVKQKEFIQDILSNREELSHLKKDTIANSKKAKKIVDKLQKYFFAYQVIGEKGYSIHFTYNKPSGKVNTYGLAVKITRDDATVNEKPLLVNINMEKINSVDDILWAINKKLEETNNSDFILTSESIKVDPTVPDTEHKGRYKEKFNPENYESTVSETITSNNNVRFQFYPEKINSIFSDKPFQAGSNVEEEVIPKEETKSSNDIGSREYIEEKAKQAGIKVSFTLGKEWDKYKPYVEKFTKVTNGIQEKLGEAFLVLKESFLKYKNNDIINFVKKIPLVTDGDKLTKTTKLGSSLSNLIDKIGGTILSSHKYSDIFKDVITQMETQGISTEGIDLNLLDDIGKELGSINVLLPNNSTIDTIVRYIELQNYNIKFITEIIDRIANFYNIKDKPILSHGNNDVLITNSKYIHKSKVEDNNLKKLEPKSEVTEIPSKEWDEYYETTEGKFEDGKILASYFYNPLWVALDALKVKILNSSNKFATVSQSKESLIKYGFTKEQVVLLNKLEGKTAEQKLGNLQKKIQGMENTIPEQNTIADEIISLFKGKELSLFNSVTGLNYGKKEVKVTTSEISKLSDKELSDKIEKLIDEGKESTPEFKEADAEESRRIEERQKKANEDDAAFSIENNLVTNSIEQNSIYNDSVKEFLKDFNITVTEYEDIRKVLGMNAYTAADLITKTIAYEKGHSIAPEVAYFAFSMLGKQNNKVRSNLRYLINKWDEYDVRFEHHKNTVLKYEGYIKNKKEWNKVIRDRVILDFLSKNIEDFNTTDKSNYSKVKDVKWTKQDFTLWNQIIESIKKFIEQFSNKFSNNQNKEKLKNLGLSIADEILNRNYELFKYDLAPEQVRKYYNKTIDSDPFAKDLVNFAREKLNLILTGSLALRKAGTMFRTPDENLHDLDFVVPFDLNRQNKDIKDSLLIASSTGSYSEDHIKNLVKQFDWFKKFKEKYPDYQITNAFFGTAHENEISSLTVTGTTNSYTIDFFIRLKPLQEEHENYFKLWKEIFIAKLVMGRPKDLIDWKHFVPYLQSKDEFNYNYPGFRHINYKQDNIDPLETTEAFSTGQKYSLDNINIEEEKEWIINNLPDWFKVQYGADVDRMLSELGNKGITFGQLKKNIIYLNTQAPIGTGYHEAFHGVFRALLTDTEALRYYQAARVKWGTPTAKELEIFKSKSPNRARFSNQQIENLWFEEKLADDFKKYKNDRNFKTANIFKVLYNKILDWIKGFRDLGGDIDVLFRKINTGHFKNSNIKANKFNKFGEEAEPYVVYGNKGSIASQQLTIKLARLIIDSGLTDTQAIEKLQEFDSPNNSDNIATLAKLRRYDKEKAADFRIFLKEQDFFYKDATMVALMKEQVKAYLKTIEYDEKSENNDQDEREVGDVSFERKVVDLDRFQELGKEMRLFFSSLVLSKTDEFGRPDNIPINVSGVWANLVTRLQGVPMNQMIDKLQIVAEDSEDMAILLAALKEKTGWSEANPNGDPGNLAAGQFLNRFRNVFQSQEVTYNQTLLKENGDLESFDANKMKMGENLYHHWLHGFLGTRNKLINAVERKKIVDKFTRLAHRYEQGKATVEDFQDTFKLVGIDFSKGYIKASIDRNSKQAKDVEDIKGEYIELVEIERLRDKLHEAVNPFEGERVDEEGNASDQGMTTKIKNWANSDVIFRTDMVDHSIQGADGKTKFSVIPTMQIYEVVDELKKLYSTEEGIDALRNSPVWKYFEHNSIFRNKTNEEIVEYFENIQLKIIGDLRQDTKPGQKSKEGTTYRDTDDLSLLTDWLSMFLAKNKDGYATLPMGVPSDKSIAHGMSFPIEKHYDQGISEEFIEEIYQTIFLQEYNRLKGAYKDIFTHQNNRFVNLSFLDTEEVDKLLDITRKKDGQVEKLGIEEITKDIKQKIKDLISSTLNSNIEDYTKLLINKGVGLAYTEKGYSPSQAIFKPEKLDPYKVEDKDGKIDYHQSFKNLAGNQYLSTFIHLTAIKQLIQGDLSLAKNEEDRVKRDAMHNNAGKTLAGIQIRVLPVTSNEKPSDTFKESGLIDTDDGQEYELLEALIQREYMFGTVGSDNRLRILMMLADPEIVNGKPVFPTDEEIRKAKIDFVSDKLVTSGVDEYGNQIYDKSSILVLTRRYTSDYKGGKWVAKPGREASHNRLEYMLANSKIVDGWKEDFTKIPNMILAKITPKSARKLFKGKLFNHNEFENAEFNPEGKGTFYQYDGKWTREQTVTGSKDKIESTDPTQNIQLIDTELPDTKENRALKQEIYNLQNKRRQQAFKQQRKLFKDPEKFFKILRETQEGSNPNPRIFEFLKTIIGEDGKITMKYDSNLLPIIKKIEQMYLAHMSKGLGLKSFVDKKTLISLPDKLVIQHNDDPDKTIDDEEYDKLSSDEKKKYHHRELQIHHFVDGKLQLAEIMVTRRQAALLGLSINDIRAINPKILEGLGIRIPTQSHHSMMPFKIVGFLPDEYGSVVVAPKELVWLQGADFDIDSLFSYLKALYKNSKGEIKMYGEATTDEEKFEEFIQDNLKNNKDVKNTWKELLDGDQDYQQILKNIKEYKKEVRLSKENISKLDENDEDFDFQLYLEETSIRDAKALIGKLGSFELAKKFKDVYLKIALQQNKLPSTQKEFDKSGLVSDLALQNQLIDLYLKVLSNPALEESMKTPTSSKSIADLVKNIEKLTGEDNSTALHNAPDGIFKAWKEVTTGGNNIALSANANLINANLTKFGIDIHNEDYHTRIDNIIYKTYQGTPAEIRRKADVISAILGAATDNTKDPLHGKLNWTTKTLMTYLEMASRGVPLEVIGLISKQPIIKILADKLETADSAIIIKNFNDKSAFVIIKDLLKSFSKFEDDVKDFSLTTEELKNGLTSKTKEKLVVSSDQKMSYKMLGKDNLTGKNTSTLELAEKGLRTATTRSFPLGKVGDVITFEGRPQKYRITNVEQLTEENTKNPEWIKQWSTKEHWTENHFKEALGGKTVHVGSYQTSFEKIGDVNESDNLNKFQYKVLKTFLKHYDTSKYFGKVGSIIKLNKGLGTAFEDIEQIERDIADLGYNGDLSEEDEKKLPFKVDRIIDENPNTKGNLDILEQIKEDAKDLFITQTSPFQEMFNKFKPNLYKYLQAKDITKAKNDFMTYLTLKIFNKLMIQSNSKSLLRQDFSNLNYVLYPGLAVGAQETTPENIKSLKKNEVFVFGSNAEGIHGKGAALTAKQKFGAKQGQAEGLQGQSYAIITKKNWRVEKSSSLEEIEEGINKFIKFAKENPNKKFYVTKLGSSLAGYTVTEIKSLFDKFTIPSNVILPKEYSRITYKTTLLDNFDELTQITKFRDNPLIEFMSRKDSGDKNNKSGIDELLMNTRAKLQPEVMERIVDGYTELVRWGNSEREHHAEVRLFTQKLLTYALMKDNFQPKNDSFINYIAPEVFKTLADASKILNKVLNEDISSEELDKKLSELTNGGTQRALLKDFTGLWSRLISNTKNIWSLGTLFHEKQENIKNNKGEKIYAVKKEYLKGGDKVINISLLADNSKSIEGNNLFDIEYEKGQVVKVIFPRFVRTSESGGQKFGYVPFLYERVDKDKDGKVVTTDTSTQYKEVDTFGSYYQAGMHSTVKAEEAFKPTLDAILEQVAGRRKQAKREAKLAERQAANLDNEPEAFDISEEAKPDTIEKIVENQKLVTNQADRQRKTYKIINPEKVTPENDGIEDYPRLSNVIPKSFTGDSTLYENSRIAGNTVDSIVKNFLLTGDETLPEGITQDAFDNIIKATKEVKAELDKNHEKVYTDIVLWGDYRVKVATEVDIMTVDDQGRFKIYEIKTSTYKNWNDYNIAKYGDLSKKQQFRNQLSAQKNLLKNQYGIKATSTSVLFPFELEYDDKGFISSAKKLEEKKLDYDPNINHYVPVIGSNRELKEPNERILNTKRVIKELTPQEQLFYKRISKLTKDLTDESLTPGKKANLKKELDLTNYLLEKYQRKNTKEAAEQEFGKHTLNLVKKKIENIESNSTPPTNEDMNYLNEILDVWGGKDVIGFKDEVDELRKRLKPLSQDWLQDKVSEAAGKEVTLEDINAQKKDIGTFKTWWSALLGQENWIANAIGYNIVSAQTKRDRASAEFYHEVDHKLKDLTKRGVNLEEMYKEIMYFDKKRNTTRLIQEIELEDVSEPAKEFYHFYQEKLEKLIEVLPVFTYRDQDGDLQTFKLDKWFVPNFNDNSNKTTIEKMKGFGNKIKLVKERKVSDVIKNENQKSDVIHLEGIHYISPKDKSTDLGHSLVSFAQSVYNYDEMTKIVPIVRLLQREIENREYQQGSNPGNTKTDNQSNLWKLAEGFIRAQVKGEIKIHELKPSVGEQYINKEGDLVEKYIDFVGWIDRILHWNSMNRIGLSPVSSLTNALFGKLSNMFEGWGGRFFNNSDLRKAEVIFWEQTWKEGTTLNDLLEKYSILQELTDYEQRETVKLGKYKALSGERLKEAMYFGQRKGEKWIQASTFLAMLVHDGYMTPQGTLTDTWEKLNEDKKQAFINKVKGVNNKLHGRYSPKEAALAQQYVGWRAVSQFRKWFPEAFEARFDKLHYDPRLGVDVEGRFETFRRLVAEGKNNFFYNLFAPLFDAKDALESGKLSDLEIANMRKLVVETIIALASIFMAMMVFGGGDDERKRRQKKVWFKTTMLIMNRVAGDVNFFYSPNQLINLGKNAVPASQLLTDLIDIGIYSDGYFGGEITRAFSKDNKFKGGNSRKLYRLPKKLVDIAPGGRILKDPWQAFNANPLDTFK